MSFSLIPKILVHSLPDLTPQRLREAGIDFLMLDFDNTIVPYTSDVPTSAMEAWLKEMTSSGIGLCVVSNSHKERVKVFCKAWGIPCITYARKPFSKGILQCKEQFHLDFSHTALAGDQIYTDVLGANCAGAISILVHPIHLHTFWLRLRHAVELPFIFIGKRRAKS